VANVAAMRKVFSHFFTDFCSLEVS
jgi:hypothetical protein